MDWDHELAFRGGTLPTSILDDPDFDGARCVVKSEALQRVADGYVGEQGKGLPTKFKVEPSFLPPRLSSLVKLNGIFAVDSRLKRIIEQIEPDMHEFWPISIRWRGLPYVKRYWALSVNQFMSSIVPEQCLEGACETRDYKMYRVNIVSAMDALADMAFSPDVQEDAHLWKERWVNGADLFFSDALMAECHSAGCVLPDHVQVRAAKQLQPAA
ncbi:imm11 family protein [Arenibacterium sp. CAU 1754]